MYDFNRLITLLIFSFAINFCFGQNFKGKVIATKDSPINVCSIENIRTKKKVKSNAKGYFKIEAKKMDTLFISNVNFSPFYYIIHSVNDSSDYVPVYADKDNRLLEEFIVNSDLIKKQLYQENENVIDYLFYKNQLIALTKYKKNNYLRIETGFNKDKKFDLNFEKPTKLFLDCLNNLHILTKDKAYQIWLDSSLHVIDVISREKFESMLKPMIYCEGSQLIKQTTYNDKQEYSLIFQKTDTLITVYHFGDDVTKKQLEIQYNNIIRLYYQSTNDLTNDIENNTWDGNLLKLAINDSLVTEVSWYMKILAKPINIKSIRNKNQILTFNLEVDSVHVYNFHSSKVLSQKIHFVENAEIIQDNKLSQIYIYNKTLSNPTIYEYDLTSNQLIVKLSEIYFPKIKNLKINNRKLYFISNYKSNFNKLYNINL